jgi:hypothetical protein
VGHYWRWGFGCIGGGGKGYSPEGIQHMRVGCGKYQPTSTLGGRFAASAVE